MLPENRIPTHPGDVLPEEFLRPVHITQVAFVSHIGVPVQRINEIIKGKRGVTSQRAWLLAQAFGTSPQFWMNLQSRLRSSQGPPRTYGGARCTGRVNTCYATV